jgi:regulator of replication initiation timing
VPKGVTNPEQNIEQTFNTTTGSRRAPTEGTHMPRTTGSAKLSMREQRKDAEKALLKAEIETLKARIRLEQRRTQEARKKHPAPATSSRRRNDCMTTDHLKRLLNEAFTILRLECAGRHDDPHRWSPSDLATDLAPLLSTSLLSPSVGTSHQACPRCGTAVNTLGRDMWGGVHPGGAAQAPLPQKEFGMVLDCGEIVIGATYRWQGRPVTAMRVRRIQGPRCDVNDTPLPGHLAVVVDTQGPTPQRFTVGAWELSHPGHDR